METVCGVLLAAEQQRGLHASHGVLQDGGPKAEEAEYVVEAEAEVEVEEMYNVSRQVGKAAHFDAHATTTTLLVPLEAGS